MGGWKFYLATFGCKVSQHESQEIKEAWLGLGGLEAASPEEADYICVNSCAITARAERDARNALNRLRSAAPSARIILTGCAAQFFGSFQPRKNAPHARPDLIVPQKQKQSLLSGPAALFESAGAPAAGRKYPRRFARARAIVKVQDGCVQNCAYCIVPQTRPGLKSESPETILEECAALADNGHAELVISGINLRLYGADRPECGDLWDLLAFLDRELSKRGKGAPRLRISSIEPSQLSEKALETLAESKLLCPHLHLSLQHASPKVLRDMGRSHYNARDILDFMDRLAGAWPVFALGTDIIVGFPGEDEADLRDLLDFIEACPLTYAHVFPYSARPGTKAGERPDQISKGERLRRAGLIRERISRKKRAFWEKIAKLPETLAVLENPPGINDGRVKGVNEFYAPCFFEGLGGGMGLVRARPLGVLQDGLLVERLG